MRAFFYFALYSFFCEIRSIIPQRHTKDPDRLKVIFLKPVGIFANYKHITDKGISDRPPALRRIIGKSDGVARIERNNGASERRKNKLVPVSLSAVKNPAFLRQMQF